MKVLFLDFDGVINSYQSSCFWHNKRDQQYWENGLYSSWQGTIKEYLAHEFCPIALSNLEELMREEPELKIVVSSTWRLGETIESLQKILHPAGLVANAIIGITPHFRWQKNKQELGEAQRGHEIQDWLDRHPDVTNFAIIDDDSDMAHLMSHLVKIDNQVGFQWPNIKHVRDKLKEQYEKR